MKLKSTIGEKNAVFGKDVDGEFKDIDMSKQAVKSEATIVMPEVKSNNENQANVKLRQLLRYEKRMDKGLLCALGLIIVLCLLGMGTSIGGALYLKFRSSHRNQTLVQALPITAPLKHHPHDFAETTTTLTTTTNAEEWVTEPEDGPATYKIRVNFTIPNFRRPLRTVQHSGGRSLHSHNS
ncbi:hypothetical protein HDE_13407 [Halotydeus destructor]|nr:hypothetical protein HDE_13407 [Halotydeus destructor]